MTFEPLAQDCTDKLTGKLCPGFIQGNGDDWLGRCRWEESEVLKGQIKVPHFCPKLKGTSEGTHNQKNPPESKYERVTRAKCPNCNQEFDPGNWRGPNGMRKRFCEYQCRWAYNNKIRLEAKGKLVTIAKVADTLADATKAMAREILGK